MAEPSYRPTPVADRFVKVRVAGPSSPDRAPQVPADVVVARRDEPLRPHALVVARDADGYVLRRVGRVSDEAVELLPEVGDARPLRVPAGPGAIVGTVIMRWCADGRS